MDTVFLSSSRQRDLRALGTGGESVVGKHEQLARLLETRLSSRHAALLAEPVIEADRGSIDWYARLPAGIAASSVQAVPINALPPDQQEAARDSLAGLLADIRDLRDRYAASDRAGDRLIAQMLGHALHVPRDDSVRMIGDQPVLLEWGHRAPGDGDRNEILSGYLHRPPPGAAPPAAPPPSPPSPPPLPPGPGLTGAGAAAVATPARTGPDWRSWLLWLLFALLVLAILSLLLRACAIGWPGQRPGPAWGFLQFCPSVTAVIEGEDERLAELDRQARLLDRLQALQFAANDRHRNCEETFRPAIREALRPAPPPFIVEAPEPEPEPEPVEIVVLPQVPEVEPPPAVVPQPELPRMEVPVPEARPTPPPPRAEPPPRQQDEFDRRLQREGAGTDADLLVTLTWEGDADLDLHILCPSGERLYFGNTAACGGRLDVDMNAGGSRMSMEPVENVQFNNPAPGPYRIEVDNFNPRSAGNRAVPYQVRIVHNGRVEIYEGAVAPGRPQTIQTVRVD